MIAAVKAAGLTVGIIGVVVGILTRNFPMACFAAAYALEVSASI